MADAPDVNDDGHLDDVSLIDTPIAPQGDAGTNDSSQADQGKDNAAATDQDDAGKADDGQSDANSTEAKDQQQANDTASQDQSSAPKDAAAQREEQNRIAAMEYQNRQRTRQQVANQIDQTYGPKSQEEYQQEYEAQGVKPEMAALQARIDAMESTRSYEAERGRIAELNAGMQAEAVNILHDMPIFNPQSPEYDEAFTNQVQQAYQTAARLQADDSGIVTNAEVPLYAFHKQMFDVYGRGAAKGTQAGQAEMANMIGRTEDNLGGSSATSKGQETLEEMEARLGDTIIT